MNIADLILFIFIIAMLFLGIKNGFVKMIVELLSSIVSFLIAVCFSKTIAEMVSGFPIFDGMKKGIQEYFTNNASLASKNVTQSIDSIALPQFVKSYLLKDFPDPSQAINSGAQALADRIFYLMLLAIVCISIFIILRVAFYFVESMIEKIFKRIKILDIINKFMGAVLGVANGILLTYVVLAIVTLLSSRIPGITAAIVESAVVSKLYMNNILIMILT